MAIELSPLVEQGMAGAMIPMFAGVLTGLLFDASHGAAKRRSSWSSTLTIALGMIAGFIAIAGAPDLPPVAMSHWLPYLIAGAFVFFAPLTPLAAIPRWGVACLAALVVSLVHLRPVWANQSQSVTVMWLSVSLLIWCKWWWVVQASERARIQSEVWLAMVVCATGLSLVCALDGSALIGQLSGALAAVAGGLFLVALFTANFSFTSSAGGIFFLAMLMLLLNGLLYTEVNRVSLGLVASSPLALLFSRLPAYRGWSSLKRGLVVVGLASVLAIPPAVYHLIKMLTATNDGYY